MKKILVVLLMFVTLYTFGQRKKSPPVFQEVNNKEVVQNIYPTAEKVEKINDFWFKIIDSNNKTLGFAMSSKSFCSDVIGYNNTTPVMIITDLKFTIKKVALLSNWESKNYVNKLVNNGFFDNWNGSNLKKARKIVPDAYTGATITANAVKKNVHFLIDNGLKSIPKSKNI